jgi:hypothetical protein
MSVSAGHFLVHPGGRLMGEEEKEDEVVDSQKMSKRDKQELQEGLCVNCAILSVVLSFLLVFLMAL